MTAPSLVTTTQSRRDRVLAALLRPVVVLPTLAVVFIIAVLFTPESSNNPGDSQLTSYGTGPGAAKGLYEVAGRLGWPTRRRLTPFIAPLDTDVVYMALGGDAPTTDESRVMLDAVRRGAGLVYIVGEEGALGDSLPLRHSQFGGTIVYSGPELSRCRNEAPETIAWLGANPSLYYLADTKPENTLHGDTSVFVLVHRDSGQDEPAVVGYNFGRGRVVAVSDPDALRNDVIRVCRFGLGPRIIEAIAYASHDGRPPLVFDEFHHGYGKHANVSATMERFLTEHPAGRAITQLLIGGLVLMIALAVRAIAPKTVPRIERRSPLEHVDALARAYERINATKTAVGRLVRGLRRRHDRGGWSLRSAAHAAPGGSVDDRFLSAVASSHPRLGSHVKRILAAEQATVAPGDLVEVAAAVDRIDAAFPAPS